MTAASVCHHGMKVRAFLVDNTSPRTFPDQAFKAKKLVPELD
jgi:hypothetical protein